jgi:hypothetical protein
MKSLPITLIFVFWLLLLSQGQTKPEPTSSGPLWTEADRKYLLDNLIRSKEEVIQETKNLNKDQWNFKESPDRWNINQIVEHIALWEILFMHEISVAWQQEPLPSFAHYLPDSLFLDQDPKGLKQNNAMEYTKPFSFAIPLGNNEGKNNVTWLTSLRDQSIDHLKKETRNIRLHYICFGRNIHQNYMMIFAHTDRHLRQLRKVKAHPNYPK